MSSVINCFLFSFFLFSFYYAIYSWGKWLKAKGSKQPEEKWENKRNQFFLKFGKSWESWPPTWWSRQWWIWWGKTTCLWMKYHIWLNVIDEKERKGKERSNKKENVHRRRKIPLHAWCYRADNVALSIAMICRTTIKNDSFLPSFIFFFFFSLLLMLSFLCSLTDVPNRNESIMVDPYAGTHIEFWLIFFKLKCSLLSHWHRLKVKQANENISVTQSQLIQFVLRNSWKEDYVENVIYFWFAFEWIDYGIINVRGLKMLPVDVVWVRIRVQRCVMR